MSKSNWYNVGVVIKNSKGGYNVILGNEKDREQPVTVELVVKNLAGETLRTVTNPILNLSDPRNNPHLSEEQKANMSDKLRFRIALAPEKTN